MKSTKFQVFVKCSNDEGQEVLRKIGDISLEEDHQGFCLKSHERQNSPEESLKTEVIYPYARKSVYDIDFLKIVIQDTRLRRAPVIKKIEIFGFPSRKNSSKDVELIHRLLNPATSTINPKNSKPLPPENLKDSTELFFNIPEELLDAITNELLVMPYVLPSGNMIDETTLEKHKKHEETYGRLPSDPFTGIIYTSENQPKFDSALKFRLDDFKMRNSQQIEIKLSGRTLGKRKCELFPSTSGMNMYNAANGHISKKIQLTSNSSNLDELIKSIYQNNQVSVFTKPKDSKIEENRWKCCKCEEISSNFYRITKCNHMYCKPCLLKLEKACGSCDKSFESKDVLKVFL